MKSCLACGAGSATLFLAVSACAPATPAATPATGPRTETAPARESLRGLTGVQVWVDPVPPAAGAEIGATDQQLRAAMVRGLERAGLPALTDEEWMSQQGFSNIRVSVIPRMAAGGGYVVWVGVSLEQVVTLRRAPIRLLAPTWQRSTLLALAPGDTAAVMRTVDSYLTLFAQEYRASNPTAAPVAAPANRSANP
jgi:hypothetical protein